MKSQNTIQDNVSSKVTSEIQKKRWVLMDTLEINTIKSQSIIRLVLYNSR